MNHLLVWRNLEFPYVFSQNFSICMQWMKNYKLCVLLFLPLKYVIYSLVAQYETHITVIRQPLYKGCLLPQILPFHIHIFPHDRDQQSSIYQLQPFHNQLIGCIVIFFRYGSSTFVLYRPSYEKLQNCLNKVDHVHLFLSL